MLEKVTDTLMNLVSHIPTSGEEAGSDQAQRIDRLIAQASWKAGATAGGLALPVGPIGMLTILPDLYLSWKIQGQLVADIAAVTGHTQDLKQEEMLFCLFGDRGADLFQSVFFQAGERLFVRRLGAGGLRNLAERIGMRLARRLFGESLSRFVPLVGALAVGRYVKADTQRVGEKARELFLNERPRSELH